MVKLRHNKRIETSSDMFTTLTKHLKDTLTRNLSIFLLTLYCSWIKSDMRCLLHWNRFDLVNVIKITRSHTQKIYRQEIPSWDGCKALRTELASKVKCIQKTRSIELKKLVTIYVNWNSPRPFDRIEWNCTTFTQLNWIINYLKIRMFSNRISNFYSQIARN